MKTKKTISVFLIASLCAFSIPIMGVSPSTIDKNADLGIYTSDLDDTPPITTIELSGMLGLNDWFLSEVLVTLTATDDLSGVDYSEYSYDGTNWQLYSEPFILATESEITIYYRSFDNSGNVETVRNQLLKIDYTPPTTNFTIDGTFFYEDWYYPNVDITITTIDDMSGVSTSKYVTFKAHTDRGISSHNWYTYTGPFDNTVGSPWGYPPIPYNMMVYHISTDFAGNSKISRTLIKIANNQINISDCLSITLPMMNTLFIGEIPEGTWQYPQVPEGTDLYINKAYKFWWQAIDRFESGMRIEMFDKIKDATQNLMEASEMGAKTYEVINFITTFLQYHVNKSLQETLDTFGEDNKFIIRAVKDYDFAIQMIEMGQYEDAVKFFKDSYRNIMKARGESIRETFISDLYDCLTEVQELETGDIIPEALNYLIQAENKLLLAIDKANNSLLAQSLIQLKDVVKNLLDVQDFGITTVDIIDSILENAGDVTYLKILEAESILMGASNKHIDKAWIYYYKAIDYWNAGNYGFALSYYAKAIEKLCKGY